MLIDPNQLNQYLAKMNITGVLHVGAHECEEIGYYNNIGIQNTDIVWIDAINQKVIEATDRGIPNVFNAIITDKDDEDIVFNVSNNVQSSSVLEFGTHSQEHPHVVFVGKILDTTVTLDTFFERNHLDASKYNLWNFDIQGAELMALKGAVKSMQHVKAMYLEVNEKELYKGCSLIGELDAFLAEHKFKRVMTLMTPHGWGDALYIHTDEIN